MHAASHTLYLLLLPENQCSRTVVWPLACRTSPQSPLSLLPSFLLPSSPAELCFAGFLCRLWKAFHKACSMEAFHGSVFPSFYPGRRRKEVAQIQHKRRGREVSRVSRFAFQRMPFLPGLFAKAVLVHDPCWLSPKGR